MSVQCGKYRSGSVLYLKTQRRLIESEAHRRNTKHALEVALGKPLGREPTPDECARHWCQSEAHVEFRRYWEMGCAEALMRQVGLLE